MTGLPHRGRKILFAAVTEYIATGTPVGSRTLSRKYALDLSPATIRNVLADLEDGGWLVQPHTSAGRVPTERALRVFIEALSEFQEVTADERRQMRERFEQIFAQVDARPEDTLRRTGQVIADLTGAAAVVASSPADSRKLSQIRFIRTGHDKLLAVLVFSDGVVENRYVSAPDDMGDSELERIHNLMADVVEGRTLGAVRDMFKRRLVDERSELNELRRRAFDLGHQALSDVARHSDDVIITGAAQLMGLPEYTDAEPLRKLMVALEDRAHLVNLLDQVIEVGSVTVYIGNEAAQLGDAQLSLVVAPYKDGEAAAGTVGVIGPTRMDYARIVPLVGATAAAISAAIKKGR